MPDSPKLAAALLALALLASACGDSSNETDTTEATTTTADTAEATTSTASDAETTTSAAADTGPAESSLGEINGGKPTVEIPDGDAPVELETIDLVEGDGTEAGVGDLLVMHYVGVLHSNGEQFDASWDRGSTFNFTLGQGRVIQGWDEGIVGMKAGGRRLLNIPSEQAYGSNSQGGIPADSALVFVVDLVSVLTPPTVENAPEVPDGVEVSVVEEGNGAEIGANNVVEVHYVVLLQATGEVFESTWDQGQPVPLQLGAGQALPEWDEGLVGKNVGDRVRIVIPNVQGLGEGLDGETLVTELTVLGILG